MGVRTPAAPVADGEFGVIASPSLALPNPLAHTESAALKETRPQLADQHSGPVARSHLHAVAPVCEALEPAGSTGFEVHAGHVVAAGISPPPTRVYPRVFPHPRLPPGYALRVIQQLVCFQYLMPLRGFIPQRYRCLPSRAHLPARDGCARFFV